MSMIPRLVTHIAQEPKFKIISAIDPCLLLGLPDDYRLGIVPASDTGAVEMAIWSVLGACGTDILTKGSFGRHGWRTPLNN